MSVRSRRRQMFFLVVIALVGCAGLVAYRWRLTEPSTVVILGVVRETEIKIAPEISGRLESVFVVSGQRVRKGELLAMLSTPELTASVQQARAASSQARANRANVDAGVRKEEVDISAQNVQIAESNLALAREQYTRSATLASKDFASKQQLDESTNALSKAEAGLNSLRAVYTLNKAGPTREERISAAAKVGLADASATAIEAELAKAKLLAPVDGVVGLLVAEPGEVISPGQFIMTLTNGAQRWFTFTLREDRLHGVAIGSPVRLATAKGGSIMGRVTELRPLGEFATWRAARAVGDHDLNSFFVRVDPSTTNEELEPGMTVWLEPTWR